MADFGAIQPRQFILDSSRNNGATLGEFHQNNNRYLCTIELFDHSVPVSIPVGAEVSIKCKPVNSNIVYVLDKNSPDFTAKVSFTPGENKVVVDRWGALVANSGQILLGVDINGMSTYTVSYNVDKDLINAGSKEVIYSETPVSDLAKSDLSNVPDKTFLDKAKASGLMQNDMADVDLLKLGEKVENTNIGKQIKMNTQTAAAYEDIQAFDSRLKSNAAFIALSKEVHPATAGMTPKDVKELFNANRYEETTPIDLTKEPYSKGKVLLLVFQLTKNNQTFTQVLPPLANNQIVMVEIIRSTGITGGKVVLQPFEKDMIDGANINKELTEDGFNGFFMPLVNEQAFEWFGHEKTTPYALVVSDEKGNVSLGVKTINFKEATVEDNGKGTVNILPNDKDAELPFVDTVLKQDFKATKVQSLDKSLRISNLGGVADLSVQPDISHEGIMATLGSDEIYNSKYDDEKFWFGDIKHKGGSFVYTNIQDKAFVIQEIDGKDPNITSGTLFLLGLSYEPSTLSNGFITQNGYFRIEFVDQNGDLLYDIDNNPMATEIHYLAGQKERKQLYLGFIKATAYTEIRPRFVTSFPNEELITLGSNTAIVIQALTDEVSSGLALLNFMAYTGYSIKLNKRYFGTNNMNLARDLIFDEPITDVEPQVMYLGDNVWLSNKSKIRLGIQNYKLLVKDVGGSILPIFSLYKRYNMFDTSVMQQESVSAKVSVKIMDKVNAFRVAMLKYTGTDLDNIPAPELLSYNNGSPVFASGWEVADSLFIIEDVVDGVHDISKEFVIPTDGKEIAFVLYAEGGSQPLDLAIEDFEIDITPPFTRAIITNNSHINEEMLMTKKEFYKTIVTCPNKYAAYRYTVNNTDTKIPVGIVKSSGSNIANNNAWSDVGSTDPNKTQGDLLFKKDGKVNFEYGGQIFNETATINNVDFWLAKVNPDGSFTEVPNSRYTTTIEANKKIPKTFISNSFNFEVKENESYRMFAKSNKADGFYLECSPNGSPLFYSSIVFDEIEPIDQRIVDLINAKK